VFFFKGTPSLNFGEITYLRKWQSKNDLIDKVAFLGRDITTSIIEMVVFDYTKRKATFLDKGNDDNNRFSVFIINSPTCLKQV
jgi:hypothetical protein